MRIGGRLAVNLLEATDSVGIAREKLTPAMGLAAGDVPDVDGEIDWSAFAALIDRVWQVLGEDAGRVRNVGRALAHVPSYVFLQRLARTVVSPQNLYDAGARWVAPASFPHLLLEQTYLSRRRLRCVASIPEPHAASAAFFHVFEGVLLELPTLLGGPGSSLVSSKVTPRTMDTVIELPASASILERARRAIRAAVGSADALELLEDQRRELAESLEAARRSTTETKELLDRLPVLVIIHRAGVLLWMNRANVELLGYESSAQITGRPLLDLVEPASRETVRERMRRPVDAQTPELSEIRLMTRGGRVVVVEISPAQEVSFDGRPARLIVARDVTERAQLRQQLLIADRMASIGMLAAGVAHEVNNPLAYVLNNVEIAIKGLTPLGDATLQSRAALGIALEGVDRIRTIVRDLLALSRVDDAVVGPVDVKAVVESTLALAGKNISERAVLIFDHEPVPLVQGSVARLGQVILNLVSNALEAMSTGPRDRNELRVAIRASDGGGAIVEITDNGVGIPPEHVGSVFDPFFTTKAPGHGTGLGLAISQRLVAEMGGRLSFETAPRRGTTFRVALPPVEAKTGATRIVPEA